MSERAPIAVALDAPDLDIACEWARAVEPAITTLKVGLELFVRYGPEAVNRIRSAAPSADIFLDLKLHDIPNTVAGAARSAVELEPTYFTVHASGGSRMIAAAVEALPRTQIAGVTVLTSMDQRELLDIGVDSDSDDQVSRLAALAVSAGARALVCSPQEVARLRRLVGPDITLITPGVRPQGSDRGDQARVSSPEEALRDGASLLVIGRPITGAFATDGASGVARAAAQIAASLS